jgi:predicted ATPase/class 3 adenylate cyclase
MERVAQPSGTVTLVFTDIEGSTTLLASLGESVYAEALEQHRELLRQAFARHRGYEVGTEGDAFFVAFLAAVDAVNAAAEGQRLIASASWPGGETLRVRMGIHSGTPLVISGNYVGLDVHRAARIMAVASGGQVLCSEATRSRVDGAALRDLGWHRLKDLSEPVRLYQLGEGDFPPLRSLSRASLPVVSGALLGREVELARIRELLSAGTQLVTLTGPGGSGKTRLALQVAADLVDNYRDGVYFVALAPLGDTEAVYGAVAGAIGLRPGDDLDAFLKGSRLLLVLDSAEHLAGVRDVVARLLADGIAVVVTSRERLHLGVEHVLPVDPLSDAAAAELFVERAMASGRDVLADETVGSLCRRLDNLPLAVELAAARARVLSPAAMLDRLDRALPFLTGGPQDAPERQRTLRATIDWSYDLLTEDERAALRRLAVFRDTFGLPAAEAVAEATMDTVGSLVDKSLLKPLADDRFLMLETVREFALEQLAGADDADATVGRHARWYRDQVLALAPERDGPRAEKLLAWYALEEANTWAALDALLLDAPEEALALADELGPYWAAGGRRLRGRDWMRQALEGRAPTARDCQRLGYLQHQVGDFDDAERNFESALQLALDQGDLEAQARALEMLSVLSRIRNDNERSAALGRRAVAAATSSDGNDLQLSRARQALADPLIALSEYDEARRLLDANYASYAAAGNEIDLAMTDARLGHLELLEGRPAAARARCQSSIDTFARLGVDFYAAPPLAYLGATDVMEGRLDDAVHTYAQSLELALGSGNTLVPPFALLGAATAARRLNPPAAARLLATATTQLEARHAAESEPFRSQADAARQEIRNVLGKPEFEHETLHGRTMTLEQATAAVRELAGYPKETG